MYGTFREEPKTIGYLQNCGRLRKRTKEYRKNFRRILDEVKWSRVNVESIRENKKGQTMNIKYGGKTRVRKSTICLPVYQSS